MKITITIVLAVVASFFNGYHKGLQNTGTNYCPLSFEGIEPITESLTKGGVR